MFCVESVPYYALEHEDVALVRVTGDLIPEERGNFRPLRLATNAPALGDEIALCGFPYGLALHKGRTFTPSFTAGIISAVLPAPTRQHEQIDYVQFDAVCNSGNSGGPVFSTRTGDVIGVVSFSHKETHRVARVDTPVGQASTQLIEGNIQIPIGLSQAVYIGRTNDMLDIARKHWATGKAAAIARLAADQRSAPGAGPPSGPPEQPG